MGVENLRPLAGKITFWGEIDRQRLLTEGSPADIEVAVRPARENLWRDGGCIARFEFGPVAGPENVYTVFRAWAEVG